eukprot:GHVU01073811.1.p1 GENE.GHVU01073811.1~~GHVU01073811.1.p1  ORF type:complete len:170 (-),score=15.36 GHVU01073811.1:710-1219(-)
MEAEKRIFYEVVWVGEYDPQGMVKVLDPASRVMIPATGNSMVSSKNLEQHSSSQLGLENMKETRVVVFTDTGFVTLPVDRFSYRLLSRYGSLVVARPHEHHPEAQATLVVRSSQRSGDVVSTTANIDWLEWKRYRDPFEVETGNGKWTPLEDINEYILAHAFNLHFNRA